MCVCKIKVKLAHYYVNPSPTQALTTLR